MQIINIVNQSALLDKTSVAAMLPSLQEQVSRDFAPLWGTKAELQEMDYHDPSTWTILIVDECGQNDDLGFHTLQGNVPVAKVGAADAMKYNIPVSAVVSHELLEMLADPATNRMIGPYVVEVCDPVSGDYYDIGGIKVSNFCTPRYFGYHNYGHYDQLDLLEAGIPEVRPGGMVMWWNGTTWCNTFARTNNGKLPWRVHYSGRSAFRAQNSSV